jgi:protocatechuate 3,4-dioxygenase beta subunit
LRPKPVAAKLTAAPSTTSVQKKVAVRGTVLGFNDKPVANAVVAVRGWSALPEGPAQTLKTDALGKFSALVVPPIRSGTDIVGRAIIVAPGFAAVSEPLKLGDNVLRLQRGRTASGIVTDSAGKPVAGARVRLSGVFWREPLNLLSLDDPSELEEAFAVQSGVDGRWKLDGLPTSGEAMFLLDDAKYVQHWTRLDLETDTTVAPLVAKPGSRIAGRVLASNGKPLPHAKVSAQGAGDGGGHASTVTAGDGRYLLKGLPTGTFTITVQDASGASVTPPLKGVKTKLGQTTPVSDIKMGLGIVVEGTVIDARTEQPLSSARIGAQGPHGFSVSTPSDAKGRYAVRVVPGDTSFYMYDIPPGYLRERVSSHKVSIAATRKQVAPFRLQKGRTLTGTAVDESGQPAVGAIIGSGSSYEDAQAAVDKNGTWNIIGIRHSRPGAPDGQWRVADY